SGSRKVAASRASNSAEFPTKLANRFANGSAGPISSLHGRLKYLRLAFLSRQLSKSCPRKRVPLSHRLHLHRLGLRRLPRLPPFRSVCPLQYPCHPRSNSLQRKRVSHSRGLRFRRLNPRRPCLPPFRSVCPPQFPRHPRSNSLQRKRVSHSRGLRFRRLNPRRPHFPRNQKLRTLRSPNPSGLLTSRELLRVMSPRPLQKCKPNCMPSFRRRPGRLCSSRIQQSP